MLSHLFVFLPRAREVAVSWLATGSFSGDGAIAARQADLALIAALREKSPPTIFAGVHAGRSAGIAVETAGRPSAEDAATFLAEIRSGSINSASRDARAGRSRGAPRALERVRQAGQGRRGSRACGVGAATVPELAHVLDLGGEVESNVEAWRAEAAHPIAIAHDSS